MPNWVLAAKPEVWLWQLAQAIVESTESRGSKYSWRPSSILARVIGFSLTPAIWFAACARPKGSVISRGAFTPGVASQALTWSVVRAPWPGIPIVRDGSPRVTLVGSGLL